MGFVASLTFILSAGSAGILKAGSLRREAYYQPLRERIGEEQAVFNTCLNCYRDHAYERVREDQNRSSHNEVPNHSKDINKQYTTYKCKYCNHTKVEKNNY